MGKYAEQHGKTRVGNFLKNTAPHILDIIGDVLPDTGALGIVKNLIDKDDTLSPQQKAEAINLLKIDLENTKDARDLQKVALQQNDLFSKRFVYYLATFWSIVGASYLFFATFTTVVNPKMADTVLGFLLGTIVATIINFFFGSSQGSKDKANELLKR
jgi:ABC-type phosphate/phosphonate transport system permease subunit